MKHNLSIIIASALALGSTAVFAEEANKSSALTTPETTQVTQHSQLELLDASVISSAKISDRNGNNLGKIERLLFDKETGMIRFAVLQVDKAWSLDNPEVIVPFKVLNITRQDARTYTVMVDTDKDKLQKAPRFEEALMDQLTTKASGESIYQHWGLTWSDTQTPGSGAATAGSTSPSSTTPSSTSGTATSTQESSTSRAITAPTTTTDGSTSDRSIGTTGTSDSNPANSDATGTTPSSTTPSKTEKSSSDLVPPLPEADRSERNLGEDQSD